MLTFQQIILRLQDYWDRQGCALLQPYDMEVGAGTSHTATFLRALGPEPWKAAYVQPSRRPGRPLRPEPEPAAALLPVPGGAEAGSQRHPGAVPGFAAGAGLRPDRQRHPLRGRRLGEPDARLLGPGLGGLAERHGSDAVHLFPAGRRHRLQADHRRDHVRAGAAGDVPAGRRQRLPAEMDRHAELRRRLPAERDRAEHLQLRAQRRGLPAARPRYARGAVAAPDGAAARAAGLRAAPEGGAHLQPARRARRDQRDRARRLHRPHPQPRPFGREELPRQSRTPRLPDGTEGPGPTR